MYWWVANARHLAEKGHLPEWHRMEALWFCMRCVKGGHRQRVALQLIRAFRMEWDT